MKNWVEISGLETMATHIGIERWVSNNVSGINQSQGWGIKNQFEITGLELSVWIENANTWL
jgi:hypothetical protein